MGAIEKEAERVKKGRASSYKTPESFTSAFEKCQKYLGEGQVRPQATSQSTSNFSVHTQSAQACLCV